MAARKILIVDDDPMIRRMAEFMLKKLGCTSAGVDGGESCIARLRDESFDMVLMDVEMPGMSGTETLGQIRSDQALRGIPVCLMTGTVTDELKARAEELGAVAVISKPLDVSELRSALG